MKGGLIGELLLDRSHHIERLGHPRPSMTLDSLNSSPALNSGVGTSSPGQPGIISAGKGVALLGSDFVLCRPDVYRVLCRPYEYRVVPNAE